MLAKWRGRSKVSAHLARPLRRTEPKLRATKEDMIQLEEHVFVSMQPRGLLELTCPRGKSHDRAAGKKKLNCEFAFLTRQKASVS